MVLSLIYGRNKYAKSSVGTVAFDTMVTEEHSFTSRVTYFPVEAGPNSTLILSDHIINQPDVVTLSGLITDTPLNILAPFNRSVAAFNQLIQIHERKQIVDVVTGIRVYKNMAITNLDVPRNIRTGQTLTFNITLQQILIDDTVQQYNDAGNIFSGVNDNTPRALVADNTNYPALNTDPPYSLKDQATSKTNVGVQGLETVPDIIQPFVLQTLSQIKGLT